MNDNKKKYIKPNYKLYNNSFIFWIVHNYWGGAAIIILFLLIRLNIVLEYKFKKKYEEYLLKIGDKNFFSYNSRNKRKEFIENKIIPFLNKDIEIIYF